MNTGRKKWVKVWHLLHCLNVLVQMARSWCYLSKVYEQRVLPGFSTEKVETHFNPNIWSSFHLLNSNIVLIGQRLFSHRCYLINRRHQSFITTMMVLMIMKYKKLNFFLSLEQFVVSILYNIWYLIKNIFLIVPHRNKLIINIFFLVIMVGFEGKQGWGLCLFCFSYVSSFRVACNFFFLLFVSGSVVRGLGLTSLSSCSSCKKFGKKIASSSWLGIMTGHIGE